MRLRSLRTALAVAGVAGLLLAACGDDPNDIEDARRADAAAATTAPSASNLQGPITILAASSLTDCWARLAGGPGPHQRKQTPSATNGR